MVSTAVIAVASDTGHNFSKPCRDEIYLLKGLGVKGDAHMGEKIQHLYDKRRDPDRPNLRQVHLMHAELFDMLAKKDLTVEPGQMGENVTTRGIDLLGLPQGAQLAFPSGALLEVTGLRFPCTKLNVIQPGLLHAVLDKTRKVAGRPFPLTGIMSIVLEGGAIRPGDSIKLTLPAKPHRPLEPV